VTETHGNHLYAFPLTQVRLIYLCFQTKAKATHMPRVIPSQNLQHLKDLRRKKVHKLVFPFRTLIISAHPRAHFRAQMIARRIILRCATLATVHLREIDLADGETATARPEPIAMRISRLHCQSHQKHSLQRRVKM
jgi:hypothetical protein